MLAPLLAKQGWFPTGALQQQSHLEAGTILALALTTRRQQISSSTLGDPEHHRSLKANSCVSGTFCFYLRSSMTRKKNKNNQGLIQNCFDRHPLMYLSHEVEASLWHGLSPEHLCWMATPIFVNTFTKPPSPLSTSRAQRIW